MTHSSKPKLRPVSRSLNALRIVLLRVRFTDCSVLSYCLTTYIFLRPALSLVACNHVCPLAMPIERAARVSLFVSWQAHSATHGCPATGAVEQHVDMWEERFFVCLGSSKGMGSARDLARGRQAGVWTNKGRYGSGFLIKANCN